jgi:hypothetical protein
MKKLALMMLFVLGALSVPLMAQTEFSHFDTTATDTFEFWMRTPPNYNPSNPPALLFWWHHFSSGLYEMRDNTMFDTLCSQRGWIAATMFGPDAGKHYQGTHGQQHAQLALDWAMQTAPFSTDSIYMVGGSMGGAAGLVWNNNHCGIHDYMPAAAVSGSGILDCELRQQQYVDSGHTLVAMRDVFGGFPWDNDSVAYEYHRASAVRISDTTKSMHFNSLHLPAYCRWGTTDSCWSCEWFAYGRPAQHLDTLRRAGHADTSNIDTSGINGHGLAVLDQAAVVEWLSGFSVNRFPANISINADEDDEYYWTRVRLGPERFVMGRYGVARDSTRRRLDINLVRNVSSLEIEFAFPWAQFDSLVGTWINYDSALVHLPQIMLTGVPTVRAVQGPSGGTVPFTYRADTLTVALAASGNYVVRFDFNGVTPHAAQKPGEWRLLSAYPNPFNSQLALELESQFFGQREIRLYDITGREAKSLMVSLQPGVQRVLISGDGLASGIYFVVLPRSGQAPRKVVLLK